ncbi:hypothetical protein A1O7_04166 [Cladophialophora yegresii CBS 114405]|uniref:Uncharacterized protein n=1 Tax=Cladophialophora yegresii CBS 114405 TaxID=1182544 RepID=W9VWH3_9EURO|nr:uncharacterized protein A1O7_04166 [Cladophialophora yegresii CBS 114405]EXJ60018.1 hypothetical protein A1O7_04166 [Cladophialophora yegresii CBS 114405]
MYNDMLDDNYWQRVMVERRKVFQLNYNPRMQIFIACSAEAYALSCSGEVLVYVGQRQGAKGGIGAFQTPVPKPTDPNPGPNILRTYELPTLQRNNAVTRVVSVDVSNNFQEDVDWENGQSAPGLDNPLLPESPASALPVPDVPDGLQISRRDVNDTDADVPSLCPIAAAAADATPGSTSSSPASSTTSPPALPKPSCVLHEQDPDQGITQAFCLCDRTATLSPLSVPLTGHQTDSCAYATIPATGKETVVTFASTYTKNCQGCTQVGFNAPTCTSVLKCTPTSAEVTVQAGSSPLHVGTLTGTALYTSVSSALEKLCPTVTQTKSSTACETGSVIVRDIDYVNAGSLDTNGELVIKVAASSYNSTTLRDAMIRSAALTAQKGSEQQSSCSNQTYTTIFKRGVLPPPSRIHGRRSSLFAGYARDRPEPVVAKGVFCNTAAFAGVGYFSAEWRKAQNPGAEAYIDATWEFQAEPGGDFLCDFIEDLELGLAVVAPEFAAGDVALAPEVQAFCGGAFDR